MDEPEKGNADKPEDAKLGRAGWFAIVVLVAFLLVSIWYAVHAWKAMAGVAMSPMGWFFLGCGIVFTIGLGAGLMALLFYSSRKNFDQ